MQDTYMHTLYRSDVVIDVNEWYDIVSMNVMVVVIVILAIVGASIFG